MSLQNFKQFSTYEESVNKKDEVWIYTRVSSKEQYRNNNSLEVQLAKGNEFAKKNGYEITHSFGRTYESAKVDFTRKEFSDMIAEIRKAKSKPLAIMIFKMSRFSRSGSGGISVVHELVDGLGVHLIEITSGDSTMTPMGKNDIIRKLVDAEKENIERLEITIPGMKSFLREGNWLGMSPIGYDHFGPKVKAIEKRREVQSIEINGDGKLLKKAWKWKLQGDRDYIILRKLKTSGLELSKQKLSAIWRNPFYCGISVHRLLEGDFVKGNWQKMVSESDFWIVQKSLEQNNSGYKKSKINEQRPLTQFLSCKECGSKLTGYEVKAKRLHYYTCQNKCVGGTYNAHTLPNSHNEGLNDRFKKVLKGFELRGELVELFRTQLNFSIQAFNSDCKDDSTRLNKLIGALELKKEKLEGKYLFDGLPKTIYDKYLGEIESELSTKRLELGNSSFEISNHKESIEKCVEVSQNISKYWEKSNIELKLIIQNLVFPSGMLIDGKNRRYLTQNVNQIFSFERDIVGDTEGQKKDPSVKLTNESSL